MSENGGTSRRSVITAAAIGGLLTMAGGRSMAAAAPPDGVSVTDLGPAVENFSLAVGVPVGDRVYVASRNIEPMQIVGCDLTSKTVVSTTPGPGISTQLLAPDRAGRYLYSAIREYDASPGNGFVRLDLSAPDAPLESLHPIPGLDPYAITVADDDTVFFGGREPEPKLRAYDPATGALTVAAVPDVTAPMIRSLATDGDRVIIGTGASLGATPTSSRSGLWILERSSGAVTSILPPELAGGVEIRDLCVSGRTLVACGTTPTGGALAIIDLDDPSAYEIVATGTGGVCKLPRVDAEGRIYYVGGGGVWRYSRDTGPQQIRPAGLEYGEIWGLWLDDGRLKIVSAFALVFTVDPDAMTVTDTVDLVQGGAPAGPQLVMSVAAGAGSVYVGGTNAVSRHDLAGGEVQKIFATSEAKDIVIRNGSAYFGQYSAVGILAHDPTVDDEWPRKLADLPPSQNRPHQLVWDEVNRLIVVGIQSDTLSGGSVMTFDPATRRTTTAVNPIDARQMVRAVTCHDGIAYLGGQVATGAAAGTVVAWDTIAQRELWRLDPQKVPTGITGLGVLEGKLYVWCYRGEFFVVDLATRAVVHTANHGAVCPNYGTLLVSRGRVYGASSKAFVRFDPATFARKDLVTLDGEWYGIPRAAIDERGRFYAVRGRNLVRIEVTQRR